MRMFLASTTAGLIMAMSSGCSSLPKDAPEELQSAHASLDDAKKADADDIVPKTMKSANKEFSSAVDLYKDSKSKNDDSLLQESKDKARNVKKMADNAAALAAEVRASDGSDLQAFVDQKNAVGALAASRAEVQSLKNRPAEAAAPAPTPDISLVATVALFPTGEAKLESDMEPVIGHLAEALKANNALRVTLVGHADHRGPAQLNQELSENRAKAVADYLESLGIAKDRITVEARGTQDAVTSSNPTELQMDRRVEAQVQALAH